MAMTDCTLVASSKLALTGRFPPQGVASTLADLRTSQSANVDCTAFTFGTGSNQVDLESCSDRTLDAAGGAAPTLTADLFTGTDLKDLAGGTAAFRHIKFIQISIRSGGSALGVRVGGAAANTWAAFFADATDKAKIFPGGPAYAGGEPTVGVVVDATHKNLLIENLAAVAVTIRIVIAGTST